MFNLEWQIGGIYPENCRVLKTDASTDYALSPAILDEAISNDVAIGLIPFMLCGTVRHQNFYCFALFTNL